MLFYGNAGSSPAGSDVRRGQRWSPKRIFLRLASLALAVVTLYLQIGTVVGQGIGSGLISQEVAQRAGLTRAWATQVGLDPARDHVQTVTLQGDIIYVQTVRGVIDALDAETGGRRWVVRLGDRDFPTMAPAANEDFVAIINGATLYVIQAKDAKPVWEKRMAFVPSAPPAVQGTRVFVVMMNGMLACYDMASLDQIPPRDPDYDSWTMRSDGIPQARPVCTLGSVGWTTDSGLVYVSDLTKPNLRYEFRTRAPIVSRLAYRPPTFIMTSRDHAAYAIDEFTGREVWRFLAGSPILDPPAVIGDTVFIVPLQAGMYAITADTGLQKWYAPLVSQFVASTPTRVYATDDFSRLHVLDRASGTRLQTLPTERLTIHPINHDNDRLYLGTPSGLLQCLHEIALTEPVPAQPPEAKEPAAEGAPAEGTPADTPPADAPAERDPLAEPLADDPLAPE